MNYKDINEFLETKLGRDVKKRWIKYVVEYETIWTKIRNAGKTKEIKEEK